MVNIIESKNQNNNINNNNNDDYDDDDEQKKYEHLAAAAIKNICLCWMFGIFNIFMIEGYQWHLMGQSSSSSLPSLLS